MYSNKNSYSTSPIKMLSGRRPPPPTVCASPLQNRGIWRTCPLLLVKDELRLMSQIFPEITKYRGLSLKKKYSNYRK